MKDLTTGQIHQALRAWADGDRGCMAAVELLIEEEWWINRLWKSDLIDYIDDPDYLAPGGEPMASIDWQKTAQKRWPQSGGELAVLMVACSLGSSAVKINLRDAFTRMASHNTGLAVSALKRV